MQFSEVTFEARGCVESVLSGETHQMRGKRSPRGEGELERRAGWIYRLRDMTKKEQLPQLGAFTL